MTSISQVLRKTVPYFHVESLTNLVKAACLTNCSEKLHGLIGFLPTQNQR